MHARQLVEVAALTAAHGPTFIRTNDRVSLSGMESYWMASKCRFDRWLRSLKTYTEELQTARGKDRNRVWLEVRPVLEEILTGEILTRVWAAVTCQYDRLRGENDLEPMTRSVFVGHLEARNRAMNLMVHGQGFGIEQAVEMNRLRRRCERWNDLLLGYVHTQFDVSDFVFDRNRARDFAADYARDAEGQTDPAMWRLVLASIRTGYQQGLAEVSPNYDLNEKIASSILACFQAELFDSTGLIKSAWMQRLTHFAEDTQGLLDLLMDEDGHLQQAPAIKSEHRYDAPQRTPPFPRFFQDDE